MSFRLCDFSVWVAASLVVLTASSFAETDTSSPPILSADEIVQKLTAANALRARALRGYRGKRVYHLDYHGLFGSHDAEVQVEATYTAPDKKEFKVTSEKGAKLLVNRVLLKLLSSEQEAQKQANRAELEISQKNYNFTLEPAEQGSDGKWYYVLEVKPRGKSQYLYDGKIWVDAHDFAVVRMQGSPAKNPSFWVSHTEIEYRWIRIGGFWLPVHTQSMTQVRMGGKAMLTIDYSDYQINAASRFASQHGSESTFPDPATVMADPH